MSHKLLTPTKKKIQITLDNPHMQFFLGWCIGSVIGPFIGIIIYYNF